MNDSVSHKPPKTPFENHKAQIALRSDLLFRLYVKFVLTNSCIYDYTNYCLLNIVKQEYKKMPKSINKEDLGLAVKVLYRQSIRSWSKTIEKPDGSGAISPSAVYAAINDGTPPWLVDIIAETIRKAKKQHPKIFTGKTSPV